MKYLLEVCIDSFESALNAQAGGADRVELCDNLYEGGTTPSIGMISMVRESLSIKLNVIIRPRGGDFLYSDAEYDIMKFDILKAKEAGADGLVFGLLLPGGLVDIERTRELVELARPMSVTFHRAFDMTPEPFKAIDDIIRTGAMEFHLTGRKKMKSRMEYRKEGIFMGGLPEIPEYTRKVADIKKLRTIRDILDSSGIQ
ncbi:MAG: copper homeostasis protein CutC [Bacteroidales bacterium]